VGSIQTDYLSHEETYSHFFNWHVGGKELLASLLELSEAHSSVTVLVNLCYDFFPFFVIRFLLLFQLLQVSIARLIGRAPFLSDRARILFNGLSMLGW
tara:strand:+ start:246 stop:539 length:294 start_codon:yes stop_codon:yes gene_type:complete